MEIKPIRTAEDYQAALKEIDAIIQSRAPVDGVDLRTGRSVVVAGQGA